MKFKNSIFLLVFIASFMLLSILLEYIMRENRGIFFTKAVDIKLELIKDTKYDIVFFGSSTTHSGISAKTIEKEINDYYNKDIKVLNFGLPTASLLELSFILEHMIEIDRKPKIVFVPYTSIDSLKNATDKNFYSGSAYYFEKYLPLLEILKLYKNNKISLDYFEKLLVTKYFTYFTHRGEFKVAFQQYLQYGRIASQGIDFMGIDNYININGDEKDSTVATTTASYDGVRNMEKMAKRVLKQEEAFELQTGLNRFVEVCKKNNIQLVLYYFPTTMDDALGYTNLPSISEQIKVSKILGEKYSKLNNIKHFDSTKEIRFSPINRSIDLFHSNYYTSILVSKKIAKELMVNDILTTLDSNKNSAISKSKWKIKYDQIQSKNKASERVQDIDLFLLNYQNENDFTFDIELQNILINYTDDEIKKLIDSIFTVYDNDTTVSIVRFPMFLIHLSKIALETQQEEYLLDYLEKDIKKFQKSRINEELMLLDSMKHPKAKELLKIAFEEIKNQKLYKQNLSYFINAHNFVFSSIEYKSLLTRHEQDYILYLVESGVIK